MNAKIAGDIARGPLAGGSTAILPTFPIGNLGSKFR